MATVSLGDVNSKNICLILLIGLPGSGKTFLTNFIMDHFQSATFEGADKVNFSDVSIIPITYDDYIMYNDGMDFINEWKLKRKIVFDSVEEFILFFKGAKERLDGNLYNINNNPFQNYSQYVEKKNLFIIIDDNMYYKSMRFEYFKLAKKHEIAFCQLYLDATLENALYFNQNRASPVPKTVIVRMHEKIERPNPVVNNWERNSLTIPAFVRFDDRCILDKLRNIIASALLSPEKYKSFVEDLTLNVEKCKIITETNLVHQLDIRLRHLIGVRLKEMKHKHLCNKNKIKYAADRLNSQRLQIMKDFKSGLLMLPSELVNILKCANKTVTDESVNNYLLNILAFDID